VHIPLIDEVDLDSQVELGVDTLKGVDKRHGQSFRYYQSGYPFEYSVVRFVTRKKTELAVIK
jgi:phospholipid-binding lipoprotein MlaA